MEMRIPSGAGTTHMQYRDSLDTSGSVTGKVTYEIWSIDDGIKDKYRRGVLFLVPWKVIKNHKLRMLGSSGKTHQNKERAGMVFCDS